MDNENIIFYYTCPDCGSLQEVYLPIEEIEDGSSYRFHTKCSECGQPLLVRIKYDVEIKEIKG